MTASVCSLFIGQSEFEQGGNELLLYMFLNFGVDFPCTLEQ